MSRFSLLEGKTQLYEQSVEAWKLDHEAAMAACDVDDLVAEGVAIFDRIQHRLEAQERIDSETAEMVCRNMKQWLRSTMMIEQLADEAANRGFMTDGRGELRKRARLAIGVMPQIEQTQRAIAEIRDGMGLDIEAAINAVRSHCRPVCP